MATTRTQRVNLFKVKGAVPLRHPFAASRLVLSWCATSGSLALRWLGPFALLILGMWVMAPFIVDPTHPGQAVSLKRDAAPGVLQRGPDDRPAYFGVRSVVAPILSSSRAERARAPDWRARLGIVVIDPGPPATAYPFNGHSALDKSRALDCLTNAIYYEAGKEEEAGQRAVAQVVLNRVRNPAWPNSICGVVYEGAERSDLHCQFTFSCNGAMVRLPSGANWMRARRIALSALGGAAFAPVGLATYYHALSVRPEWAKRMRPATIIGGHIFYRAPATSAAAQHAMAPYLGVETSAFPGPYAYAAPIRSSPMEAQRIDADLIQAIAPVSASPPPASIQDDPQERLPQSTIRPEFRETGRPLQ